MKPNIFPFTERAFELFYAQSPKLAERLWKRDRNTVAPNQTYYAFDLVVHGHTEVEIHVRTMADSFSGGIGPVVFKYKPSLYVDDVAELGKIILKEQMRYAEDEFSRREEARIAAETEAIRKELFDNTEEI